MSPAAFERKKHASKQEARAWCKCTIFMKPALARREGVLPLFIATLVYLCFCEDV